MYYWGKPQFYGVKAAAANLGHGKGNYTLEQFRQDYPQFFNSTGEFLGSQAMLDEIINMANVAVQPDKWLEGVAVWRGALCGPLCHPVSPGLRTVQRDAGAGRPPPVP